MEFWSILEAVVLPPFPRLPRSSLAAWRPSSPGADGRQMIPLCPRRRHVVFLLILRFDPPEKPETLVYQFWIIIWWYELWQIIGLLKVVLENLWNRYRHRQGPNRSNCLNIGSVLPIASIWNEHGNLSILGASVWNNVRYTFCILS